MSRYSFVASALLVPFFLGAGPIRAAEVSEIQTLLKHEIVGPDLPMTEVQWYCDERVPAMPNVQTVDAMGARSRHGFARPFSNGSSTVVRPPAGATRRRKSSGWTRSTAGQATGSANCATRPCPVCGFPPCCTSRRT